MKQELKYKTHCNFNGNITGLKNGNQAIKLLNHIEENEHRRTGQEFLNKNSEMKNIVEGSTKEIVKEFEKIKDKLPKGGKGSKPFRFITTGINLEPILKNQEMITEGSNEMKKYFENKFGKENIAMFGLHLNESRPGIHIALRNYSVKKKKGGVGKDGKKIRMSGDNGRLVNEVGQEGEKIIEKLCKKGGVEYKQESYTNIRPNKTIQKVRATKPNPMNEVVRELQEEELLPLVSRAYQTEFYKGRGLPPVKVGYKFVLNMETGDCHTVGSKYPDMKLDQGEPQNGRAVGKTLLNDNLLNQIKIHQDEFLNRSLQRAEQIIDQKTKGRQR